MKQHILKYKRLYTILSSLVMCLSMLGGLYLHHQYSVHKAEVAISKVQTDVKTATDELKSEVDTKQDEQAKLESTISAVETKATELEKNIADLKAQEEKFKQELEGLSE